MVSSVGRDKCSRHLRVDKSAPPADTSGEQRADEEHEPGGVQPDRPVCLPTVAGPVAMERAAAAAGRPCLSTRALGSCGSVYIGAVDDDSRPDGDDPDKMFTRDAVSLYVVYLVRTQPTCIARSVGRSVGRAGSSARRSHCRRG